MSAVPVLLGGVALVVFALLSLSASEGEHGRKRVENTLFGALVVAAVVLVLARAGLAWLGIGLALLWGAARKYGNSDRRDSKARTGSAPAATPASDMTRAEAYAVLGLDLDAPEERILAEYRRLMKKVHPDQGGTTYLATRLNQAKEVLLGK